jgi:hypothetical protein
MLFQKDCASILFYKGCASILFLKGLWCGGHSGDLDLLDLDEADHIESAQMG